MLIIKTRKELQVNMLGFLGIRKRNKWQGSTIYINGRRQDILGYFTNEKEAAQAYQNELNKIKL